MEFRPPRGRQLECCGHVNRSNLSGGSRPRNQSPQQARCSLQVARRPLHLLWLLPGSQRWSTVVNTWHFRLNKWTQPKTPVTPVAKTLWQLLHHRLRLSNSAHFTGNWNILKQNFEANEELFFNLNEGWQINVYLSVFARTPSPSLYVICERKTFHNIFTFCQKKSNCYLWQII